MTRKEQLLFLLDIQSEAGRWEYNGYEEEVKQRIRNLVEELQDPDEAKQKQRQVANNPKAKYRETHVKIRENGKEVWAYKEDCERVVDPNTGRERWQRKKKQQTLQDAIFDIDKV